MIKSISITFFSLISSNAMADLSGLFKDEAGKTNWQHLANWSAVTLILSLAILLSSLFFAHRRLRKSNDQLHAIREGLEDRVAERTATLEKEVNQHLTTSEQLLRSESYIKNILASMPLVLVSLDAKGIITQWNEKAEELSGIAATSAIGNNLWQVYPEIVLTWEQVALVIEKGESFTYPHRQRGVHFYDVTLYPLKGAGNQGVVILVNDVSKQKQAENMLVHNEKIASVTELASSMAHDINTPLQGMLLDLQSFQQLLAKSNDKQSIDQVNADKLQLLLSDASGRADTVASIVKNLLSFSRGRNEKKQQQQLTLLVDNAVMLAKDMLLLPGKLQFSGIKIECDYQKNLPSLYCYPTELQHVFLTLIRHACYALDEMHVKEEQPFIKISINKEVDSLWICFQHNGAILSDEEQVSIFEPSMSVILPQRDVDSQKRLSFANFIITEQHQGRMAVTSDEENGTKFHIELLLDAL
ncbi:MAG: PAS domain S-box protein [Oceanospirillaceae bacterium]